LKLLFIFLVVTRSVKVFKISSPTLTTAQSSMDWKGYVVAIAALLCSQGRWKCFSYIQNLAKNFETFDTVCTTIKH